MTNSYFRILHYQHRQLRRAEMQRCFSKNGGFLFLLEKNIQASKLNNAAFEDHILHALFPIISVKMISKENNL